MLVMTAAMKQETETVTRWLEGLRRVEAPGCHAWYGRTRYGNRGGTTVLALRTGIGKERAERALSSVLDGYPAGAVISVGFGGALLPDQRAGDIIICTETVSHDPSGEIPVISAAHMKRSSGG